MKRENPGDCPVCGQATKQDETMVYCENCGFNIVDKNDNYQEKPNKTVGIDYD